MQNREFPTNTKSKNWISSFFTLTVKKRKEQLVCCIITVILITFPIHLLIRNISIHKMFNIRLIQNT